MIIEAGRIPGVFHIRLAPRGDARGYFMRQYDRALFADAGLPTDWTQENEAVSTARHIVRGLHFQRAPAAETKLIRAVVGAVFDVFVDLRDGSPTFGAVETVVLDAETRNAVLIPKGFAHGYCTLTDYSLVHYKVDSPYTPEMEGGLAWNDPDLGIEWPSADVTLSDKDRAWPRLRDLRGPGVPFSGVPYSGGHSA